MGREMGLVLSRQINTWGLGVGGGGVAELQAALLIRSIISINQSSVIYVMVWSGQRTRHRQRSQ